MLVHTNAQSGADGGRRLCEVLVPALNVQRGWGCALHLELSLFICFGSGNTVFVLAGKKKKSVFCSYFMELGTAHLGGGKGKRLSLDFLLLELMLWILQGITVMH